MAKGVAGGSQIPLNLSFQPEHRFESFVVPVSSTALAVVEHALSQPSLTLLQGLSDSGKTHLLLAACHAARQAQRRISYLPLQQEPLRRVDALTAAQDSQLIAVDDLDSLAGDLDAQVALFHLLNHARASGATVILAGRASPSDMGLQLPDLVSRLNSAVRVPLQVLDDEGRKLALRKRALSRGLEFDDAAMDWLLARADRKLSVLMSLFRQLDHASSVRQKRLTLPFVRETLADTLPKR